MNWKFHLHVAADYKQANLSNTASPQVRIKGLAAGSARQQAAGGGRRGEISGSRPKLKSSIWGKANCCDVLLCLPIECTMTWLWFQQHVSKSVNMCRYLLVWFKIHHRSTVAVLYLGRHTWRPLFGFLHWLLFTAFWGAEGTGVIGSPEPSRKPEQKQL